MSRVVVIDPTGGLVATIESLLHRERDLEVQGVESLDDAWPLLSTEGVLVAGPTLANKRGVEALQAVHRRNIATRIVLAFDRRPGASMPEVVAVGADALVDPGDAADLRAGLDRALRASRELVPLASLSQEPEHRSTVLTVTSATGGCGKTFAATSLAAAMASWAGVRVALVDLDLQFGEIAASLGIRSRRGWSDLVGVAPDDLEEFLGDALISLPNGIDVLCAPIDPVHADAIGGQHVGAVLDALRRTHDVVLCDTATGLTEATLAALDRSDEIVIMSLLDVASIRNLRSLDQTLDRLDVSTTIRRMVLNKDRAGVGLTAEEVERVLDRSFVAKIPYDDSVVQSMNHGRPVVLDHPADSVLAPLVDLIVAVAPEARRAELTAHRPDLSKRRLRLPWRRSSSSSSSAPRPTTEGAAETLV